MIALGIAFVVLVVAAVAGMVDVVRQWRWMRAETAAKSREQR